MGRVLDPTQPRWTKFSYHRRCWELKSTRTLVATRSLSGTMDRPGRDDNVGKHGRLCRPSVLGGRLGGDPESVPGKCQRVYLTSIFDPTLDPNRPQHYPSQADTLQRRYPGNSGLAKHSPTLLDTRIPLSLL